MGLLLNIEEATDISRCHLSQSRKRPSSLKAQKHQKLTPSSPLPCQAYTVWRYHKPGSITLIFLLKKPLLLKHRMFVVDIINCLSKGKIKTRGEVDLCRALTRFTMLHIIPAQGKKRCKWKLTLSTWRNLFLQLMLQTSRCKALS